MDTSARTRHPSDVSDARLIAAGRIERPLQGKRES